MKRTLLHELFFFAIAVLLQAVIFSHISILGYATPFLYLYCLLKRPTSLSRNAVLVYGAALGLLIDLFSDTPGVHLIATTAVAFLQRRLLLLYVPAENAENVRPSVATIGSYAFAKYLLSAVLIHNLLIFLLIYFSVSSPLHILLSVVSSALLSFICLLAIENMRKD